MANLSSKELSALEDLLEQEQSLIKKYKMYAQQVTDEQIRTKYEQIAAKHQNHFTRLYSQLG